MCEVLRRFCGCSVRQPWNGSARRDINEAMLHTEKSFPNLTKSYRQSDCIYHAPIDMERNGQCPFAFPNQSVNII